MIKIAMIDDHQLFIDGLKLILNGIDDVVVLYQGASGSEALKIMRENRNRVDVLLMDISMPDISGIEVLKTLRAEGCEDIIIILSMHDCKEMRDEAEIEGANAYVLKDACVNDLMCVIRKVIADKSKFVSAGEFKEYPEQGQAFQDDLILILTPSERKVLKLICDELTSKEIAASMGLSVNTIETHRKNIMFKTDSKNLAGLVKFAHASGIV